MEIYTYVDVLPGFPRGYYEHRRDLGLKINEVCKKGEKCPFCKAYLVFAKRAN